MRGIRRTDNRLRTLHHGGQGGTTQQAGVQVTGAQARPDAVATMPVAQVLVYPSPSAAGYATIAYRGLQPLWAPDGETILAQAPGRWGQLRLAGRP